MISWFDDAQDEDDEFIEAAKANQTAGFGC